MKSEIYKFVEKLNTKFGEDGYAQYNVEFNRTYAKVITTTKHGSRSVWGFIVLKESARAPHLKQGDLLKASSWSSPSTKKARGNVLDGSAMYNWTGPVYLDSHGRFELTIGKTLIG